MCILVCVRESCVSQFFFRCSYVARACSVFLTLAAICGLCFAQRIQRYVYAAGLRGLHSVGVQYCEFMWCTHKHTHIHTSLCLHGMMNIEKSHSTGLLSGWLWWLRWSIIICGLWEQFKSKHLFYPEVYKQECLYIFRRIKFRSRGSFVVYWFKSGNRLDYHSIGIMIIWIIISITLTCYKKINIFILLLSIWKNALN